MLGKRLVETSLAGKVTIREENAAAALEVMSRFAIDPHWLIYLPPTMSPTESTSTRRACWSIRTRHSPTTRSTVPIASCARKSTWARGQW